MHLSFPLLRFISQLMKLGILFNFFILPMFDMDLVTTYSVRQKNKLHYIEGYGQ